MTVFSNGEEKWAEDNLFKARLNFYMADALRLAGGEVTTSSPDFEPYVVVDRELITGQNIKSDHPIAAKFTEALDRSLAEAPEHALANA